MRHTLVFVVLIAAVNVYCYQQNSLKRWSFNTRAISDEVRRPKSTKVLSEDPAASPFDAGTASMPDYANIRPDPGTAQELTEENVMKVLDEIRPYLVADGGDVQVANIDLITRDIELELMGACGNCPSSTVTMKMGIERVLRENFDNLGNISSTSPGGAEPQVPILSKDMIESTLANILPAIQGMGGSVEVRSVVPETGEVLIAYGGPPRLRKGVELVLKDIKGVQSVTIEVA